MIKLSVNETKCSSLPARTRALILCISIWIFDFGPEKWTGLSRNGPLVLTLTLRGFSAVTPFFSTSKKQKLANSNFADTFKQVLESSLVFTDKQLLCSIYNLEFSKNRWKKIQEFSRLWTKKMQKLGQTLFLYWIEVLHLLRDTVQVLSGVKCICSLKIQLGWDLNIFPVLLHMTEDQWPHELGKTVSSNERGETEIEADKI